MDGLSLLLLGGIVGLLLALLRPQTVVVPPVFAAPTEERGDGCLSLLVLLILALVGLVLLGGPVT